jgi:hypothetical protein
MRKIISLAVLVAFSFFADAQEQFTVSISPAALTSVPALHSGAFTEWNGKWIFIGGRIDGLHNFQAGQAFDAFSRNDSVFVVDPANNTHTSASLSTLYHSMYEAICSSNMEYYREDSMLYMVGGYGRNDSMATKITFPILTAINLNTLLNAVAAHSSVNSSFRQLTDTTLAIAGGHLEKTDSMYCLVFGHRFDGLYDEHTGSVLFVQQYSNQVRKFTIHDDGTNLSINTFQAITDTDNFHRRDYNLVPQIFPNGDSGFTAFGGVFQKFANLPFLSPVDLYPDSAHLNSSFNQNLDQYETAAMPVYDLTNNFMHTIFFGGMSLYTYDTTSHALVQDTLIPFVKTISKVSRDGSGNLTEFSLPVSMPAFLGTNAHFIPDRSNALYSNSIINLNSLSGITHVGWIVGGIESDQANIAHLDPGSMSRPNATVYDVFIDKTPNAIHELQIKNIINDLSVYPNPSGGLFNIQFSIAEKEKTEVMINDATGKKISALFDGTLQAGISKFVWDGKQAKAGTYYCHIKAGNYSRVVKMTVAK